MYVTSRKGSQTKRSCPSLTSLHLSSSAFSRATVSPRQALRCVGLFRALLLLAGLIRRRSRRGRPGLFRALLLLAGLIRRRSRRGSPCRVLGCGVCSYAGVSGSYAGVSGSFAGFRALLRGVGLFVAPAVPPLLVFVVVESERAPGVATAPV